MSCPSQNPLMTSFRTGYTLPVFACASAVAALLCLRQQISLKQVSIDLITPNQTVEIEIEQVSLLSDTMALAITRSDPGDNLDLTRNTPIWALVELVENAQDTIAIAGGEGIGINPQGKAAIYSYAETLLRENLHRHLFPTENIKVTIILPEGRRLAQRTSNAAFGVVEGLSLLGTTGISQALTVPGQLEAYQEELATKAAKFDCLVFCLGENGLDLAPKFGINPQRLVKTANWLGPMLATAGILKIPAILLFGYHGKLIKLAGGIFHTHHHLADARLEILTANLAFLGLPNDQIHKVFQCPTCEEALQLLHQWDSQQGSDWVSQVYKLIATKIDHRSQEYIQNHSDQQVTVGCILFSRQRNIIVESDQAKELKKRLE